MLHLTGNQLDDARAAFLQCNKPIIRVLRVSSSVRGITPGRSSTADLPAPLTTLSHDATLPIPTYTMYKRYASPSSPSLMPVTKQQCSEFLTLGTSLIFKAMPDTSPVHMIVFTNEMCERDERIKERDEHLQAPLDSLLSRIVALEEMVRANRNKSVTEISSVRGEINALLQCFKSGDSCEILITGLPATLDASHAEIVDKIFEAINVSTASANVIQTHLWKQNHTARSSPPSSGSSVPASTSAPSAQATFSLVVQLGSPILKDFVISKSNVLNAVDAKAIFGQGGARKIFLNALWPKQVYTLWKKALVAELVHVHTEGDLSNLPPMKPTL